MAASAPRAGSNPLRQSRSPSQPAERRFPAEGRPSRVAAGQGVARKRKTIGAAQGRFDGERAAGHDADAGIPDRMRFVIEGRDMALQGELHAALDASIGPDTRDDDPCLADAVDSALPLTD